MGLSQFTGVVREATCAKSPGGVRQSKDSNPIFLSSQCSVSTPGFLSPLKEAPVPQSSVLPTLSCPAPTISHPPPQAPPHSFCGGGGRGRGRAPVLPPWSREGLACSRFPAQPHLKCPHRSDLPGLCRLGIRISVIRGGSFISSFSASFRKYSLCLTAREAPSWATGLSWDGRLAAALVARWPTRTTSHVGHDKKSLPAAGETGGFLLEVTLKPRSPT